MQPVHPYHQTTATAELTIRDHRKRQKQIMGSKQKEAPLDVSMKQLYDSMTEGPTRNVSANRRPNVNKLRSQTTEPRADMQMSRYCKKPSTLNLVEQFRILKNRLSMNDEKIAQSIKKQMRDTKEPESLIEPISAEMICRLRQGHSVLKPIKELLTKRINMLTADIVLGDQNWQMGITPINPNKTKRRKKKRSK